MSERKWLQKAIFIQDEYTIATSTIVQRILWRNRRNVLQVWKIWLINKCNGLLQTLGLRGEPWTWISKFYSWWNLQVFFFVKLSPLINFSRQILWWFFLRHENLSRLLILVMNIRDWADLINQQIWEFRINFVTPYCVNHRQLQASLANVLLYIFINIKTMKHVFSTCILRYF